ncbi:MAG: hypothetical protein Q9209_003621 [Squamulea sp. 1 TL-2023]
MDEMIPISSLNSFRKLKNLKVGMYVLFGIGEDSCGDRLHEEQKIDEAKLPDLGIVLAESLETIYFSHTEGRIGILARAIQRLLSAKTTCLPRLRKISVEAYTVGLDQSPSLRSLQDMAAEVEVKLRIIERVVEDNEPSELGRGWDGSVTWAGLMGHGGQLGRYIVKANSWCRNLADTALRPRMASSPVSCDWQYTILRSTIRQRRE